MHEFPIWLRLTHFVNFLFLTLLIRSGIQILADHPKLYWNDHCHPGSEWIRFGKRDLPQGALWTSMDEAVDVSPLIAIPGKRHALGAGRHWHFLTVLFWTVNGFIYVALLFLADEWQRLVPTSFDIIPRALHTIGLYLTLHAPPLSEFQPYDPLQKLAYFSVVFILTPLTILTGVAMSPAMQAKYQWYARMFGGHQKARSLHFLCMLGYLAFLIVHVTMVFLVYFKRNVMHITLGVEHGDYGLALSLFWGGIATVILLNIAATIFTRKHPSALQEIASHVLEPLFHVVYGKFQNLQHFSPAEISPYFRINGRPPETSEFLQLMQNDFSEYKLRIFGLVEKPIELSLSDLMTMKKESHISRHVCIQGWTAIGEWGGVPVSEILKLCQPKAGAKYLYFHSYQTDPKGRHYYTSLSMNECKKPRTILAYEMNHELLQLEHGAPLRLRVETKLGFKMCKWVKSIEVVASMKDVGTGHGGYREDHQYYGTEAQI